MGLVKQAYSAWVQLAPNARPRKWHLTAYFTYLDLPNIPTIDRDQLLSRINVPPGIYKSGKARSRNSVGVAEENGCSSLSSTSSNSPSPGPTQGNSRYSMYPPSPRRMAEYPTDHQPDGSMSPRYTSAHVPAGTPHLMLPPIHSTFSGTHQAQSSQSRNHVARPAEDQRLIQMLNSRHIM